MSQNPSRPERPWAALLPSADRAAAETERLLAYLAENYGPPATRPADATRSLVTFALADRELTFLVSGASILAGWRLWRGDLCSLLGPPGLVTAGGTGSASFIPVFGSSAGAIAGAITAATLDAGQKLWSAIDRACTGRCQSPCECKALPTVPGLPAISFAPKTFLGVPVAIKATASITLSALVVCA